MTMFRLIEISVGLFLFCAVLVWLVDYFDV